MIYLARNSRDFASTIEKIDQVWCSDITYIGLVSGFVYLAAIIDAFSWKVVGYAISMILAAELALEALRMALATRNTSDLIHLTPIRAYSTAVPITSTF